MIEPAGIVSEHLKELEESIAIVAASIITAEENKAKEEKQAKEEKNMRFRKTSRSDKESSSPPDP